MSGSTIGGVIGGIVGSFIPVVGTQLGFMIGSILGGAIDPDKVYGPRLTDAQTQTSQVGIPIPFVYGTASIKGNIIWRDPDLKERKKESGKGGPESVTFRYTRSYAIGICEGQIKAIKTIKRNGKVVYEVSKNANEEYEGGWSNFLAQSAKWMRKCTIYKGDEAQMPDPTIEAVEGIGNAPAHRGLAYIVVKDDDLTDFGGAVPQYDFVVVMEGQLGLDEEVTLRAGQLARFADADFPLVDAQSNYQFVGFTSDDVAGYTGTSVSDVLAHYRALGWSPDVYLGYSYRGGANIPGIGVDLDAFGVSNYIEQPSVENNEEVVLVYNQFEPDVYLGGDFNVSCALTTEGIYSQSRRGGVGFRFSANPGGKWQLGETCSIDSQIYYQAPVCIRVTRKRMAPLSPPAGTQEIPDLPGYYLNQQGEVVPVETFTEVPGTFRVLSMPSVSIVGGTGKYTRYENGPAVEFGDPDYSNSAFWQAAYDAAVGLGKLPAGWTYGVEYPVAAATVFEGQATIVETIDRDRIVLGSIVGDLCDRSGLANSDYDVSQLTDLLDGYVVATIGGADSFLTPLSQAYFFDVAEWDAKIRFVKRGGAATFSLNADDLAERDGDAIEEGRVQEVELLRKVTVGYIDPVTGFSPATQVAERSSQTVEARGESAVEIPVVMSTPDAAKVAEKRMKVAWGEPDKLLVNLPYRFSFITPTDVGFLTDKAGKVHRIRLMKDDEDSGIKIEEFARDCQAAYSSTAVGVSPKPPTLTAPGLIGGTTLEVINGPVMRDGDDQLGLYLPVRGQLPGWHGASILLSTDGGATSTTVAEISDPAVIGYTVSSLAPTVQDYRAEQTLDVVLPEPPASVDYLALLQFANRAFLGDEVIQFQTVTDLGSNTYRLSGLIRSRYDTQPVAHAIGTRFVLFDSTVVFVRAENWLLGQTIHFKAVSFGTSADAYPWTAYAFTKGVSQTEWKPVGVVASDVGSDITVSWIGRRRLGSTRRSVHSQHFRGYRVTYSNGGSVVATHDVTTLSDTLAGGALLPGAVTITVAGINAITGAGTPSETISA